MTADTQQIPDIAATPAWQALQRHHDEIGDNTSASCSPKILSAAASWH